MESSDEVMVPSSATTSSSAASCDMLKKPCLQQVRSFLSSIYGVSSHPHWPRCADFLRGRVASQLQAQDDRVQRMAAWKRVTLALLLMLETAGKQVVMDYIAKKSMELKDNDEMPKERNTKEKKQNKNAGKTVIIQGIGKPLPRSSAQKTWHMDPKQCNHPAEYMRCRANRYEKWWICLECGSQRNARPNLRELHLQRVQSPSTRMPNGWWKRRPAGAIQSFFQRRDLARSRATFSCRTM